MMRGAPPFAPNGIKPLPPQTCLIVDDSRIIRKVARRIVEDLGFEVDEAADGADKLASGATSAADGAAQLSTGLGQLSTGMNTWAAGATSAAGCMQLASTDSIAPKAKILRDRAKLETTLNGVVNFDCAKGFSAD